MDRVEAEDRRQGEQSAAGSAEFSPEALQPGWVRVPAWVWGGQCSTEGPGLVAGGALSDSLGFTLQGRQKPLCVQALTSSSTSHPTPPGPFKKKKILLPGPRVGVGALVDLGRETVYVPRRGPGEVEGGVVMTVPEWEWGWAPGG